MFGEKLNEYLELLGCSGKEFAEWSGISEATISRYRSGARMPKPESDDLEKLCKGICRAAEQKGIESISYKDVFDEFAAIAARNSFDYESLQIKLNALCSVMSVNVADMSKRLKYDSSYISRIRRGKRKPANPREFAFDVAVYFSQNYDSTNDIKIIAELIKIKASKLKNQSGYASELTNWLIDGNGEEKPENPLNRFLNKLDKFDLNEYIKSIRFDELKVPTLPFTLPISKTYYGTEDMKAAEIDFLKATALSKSKERVFMYSDMQMDDMAADMDFSKKYMFGLAAMLKKGLNLDVGHNLNRPFNELMLGLECWIPLYMTGQITPYYLKGVHNRIFCRLLNVSGSAALAGESISGHHSKGKYYLTKNKTELEYYRETSGYVLKKAQPLMEIYTEDNANALSAFLLADSHTNGSRKNILSTLPIYTASNEFLNEFLTGRNVSEDEINKILEYADGRKNQILDILKNNDVCDEIPYLSREEFESQPFGLSLSPMFCDKNFEYTYEEYSKHLALTEDFAKSEKNYSVIKTRENAFVNIQVSMHSGEFVMISKNKAPTIHFVIRHPTLRNAIENIDFPVI